MIKGIIFDMDGVISDTQYLHAQIESEIFGRYGVNFSPDEITRKYAGVKVKKIFNEVLNNPPNLEELVLEKRQRMLDLVSEHVEPIKGAIPLIKMLHKENFPLAVASASQRNYVKIILHKLDIAKYFTSVVGGDIVKNGKPDPESFLLAAEYLNLPPENCLVFEDGISGMQAAKSANMKCIGLIDDLNVGYPTDNLVTTLEDVDMDYVRVVERI